MMRRRKFANENLESNPQPVMLNDGELQDIIFCLHCHRVNAAAATECKFCQQPLTEPPSDLRNRLQRISQQASHREPERQRDRVMQSIEEFPDILLRPLRSIGFNALKVIIDPLIRLVYWGLDAIEYIDMQIFDHHLQVTVSVILWITVIILIFGLVGFMYVSLFGLP